MNTFPDRILTFICNPKHYGSPFADYGDSDYWPPNLSQAYELWEAARQGGTPFLASEESTRWFGHSLWTSTVKLFLGYETCQNIAELYAPNVAGPNSPYSISPAPASYGPPHEPGEHPRLQLDRYSCLSAFFWHIMGALDVMSVGLAFLYDFEGIGRHLSLKKKELKYLTKKIETVRISFGDSISLLEGVSKASTTITSIKTVTNLANLYSTEGLRRAGPNGNTTRCQWFEKLKTQRDFYTHVGFPTLFVDNSGVWRIAEEPRGDSTTGPGLRNPIDLCQDIYQHARRFIGEVYGCAWTDFSPYLSS